MELKTILKNDRIKGIIAVIAAVIMWYTPTHIDLVIETLLTAFGIQKLIIKEVE